MSIEVRFIFLEDLHDTLEIRDTDAGVILRTYSPTRRRLPNETVYERVMDLLQHHQQQLMTPGLKLDPLPEHRDEPSPGVTS